MRAPEVRNSHKVRPVRPRKRGAVFTSLSRWSDLPWPVLVYFLSLLQPSNTSIYVGDLRITIYRVLLLISLLPGLFALFGRRCGHVMPCDFLMIVHVVWVT